MRKAKEYILYANGKPLVRGSYATILDNYEMLRNYSGEIRLEIFKVVYEKVNKSGVNNER